MGTGTNSKSKKEKAVKTGAKNKASEKIKIEGNGKYPLVNLHDINIVKRDEKSLFYNPRSEDSFPEEELAEFEYLLRMDSLQTPLTVRAIGEGNVISRIELIAGERRFRCLRRIVEQDLPCFDEEAKPPAKYRAGATVIYKADFAKVVDQKDDSVTIQLMDRQGNLANSHTKVPYKDLSPTVPGSTLYHKVPCKIAYNCSDERALRLAFTENDQHKSLKTKEEIALVERLLRRGLKQGEIALILGTNETWVSQTLNFRNELPQHGFAKLLDGTMSRHVAVALMGYKIEDREKLFKASLLAEKEDTEERLEQAHSALEVAEDDEELALDEQKDAKNSKDERAAKQAEKKVVASRTRQFKAKDKIDKISSEAGHLKQGHVAAGAVAVGVKTKKSRMLPKEQIEQFYVANLTDMLDDEDCENAKAIRIIRDTAQAILEGERNPLTILGLASDDSDEDEEVEMVEDEDGEFEEDDIIEHELANQSGFQFNRDDE